MKKADNNIPDTNRGFEMAILKVRHKGQEITQKTLEENHEYWIGRSPKAEICLNSPYGISRKHLKLFQEEQNWKVECASSLGGLMVCSEELKEHSLNNGDIFHLQNFEFHFVLEEQVDTEHPPQSEEESDSSADNPDDAPLDHENEAMQEEEGPKAENTSQNGQDSASEKFPSQNNEQKFQEPAALTQAQFQDSSEDSLQSTPSDKKPLSTLSNDNQQTSPEHTNIPTVVTTRNRIRPTLVISLSEDEKDQTVVLEDNDKWILGRDPSCDICIEDRNISREHFEITREDQDFFISDLGSSNGTALNGEFIEPHKPRPFKSGSTISILEIEIFFDIIDPSIKKESVNLPVVQNTPETPLTPSSQQPLPALSMPSTPNVIMGETMLSPVPKDISSSRKKRFIILGSLAVLAIGGAFYFNFYQDNKEPSTEDTTAGEGNNPLQQLDVAKQEQVKELYNLAKQLYQMQKYELCVEKLNTLESLIPFYEQSSDLIQACQNGADNLRTQIEIERRNKEKEKISALISSNIKECKEKFSSFESIEGVKQCLAPTIENDPENFEVTELISKMEMKLVEKKQRQIQRQALKKSIKNSLSIYNKAKQLKTDGKILKAISAYKSFLKKKHTSSVADTVQTAQQELENMETELDNKLTTAMTSCENLINSKKYKEAHQACQTALTVIPNHKPALQYIQTAVKEINKQLKILYEESVLNESLGQIEIAKKIWNKILEKDIPNGNYYKKARGKLDKY